MARVSVSIHNEQRSFAVTEQGISIGRALDNEIVLNDVTVSRQHAVIALRQHEAYIQDLGSRNGIFVNRLRVKESLLNDGDTIRIGPFDIHFENRAVQSVVLDDKKYFPLAADVREIQSNELPEFALDLKEFYRISKRLDNLLKVNDLLEAVMDEVLKLIPAHRGILLLRRGGELIPMIVYPPNQNDITLSSTIAHNALEGNEAVLTRDARLDFAGSDSIISANIRSAICVPLISESKSIGLIYLDSPGRDQFTEQQRDLLAALANQAAINIQRARLTEELHKQEQLLQNLERFMSPNVAKLVASYYSQHGQLWEPQELIVSVLFADVKGFSTLSENLSPREAQDLLNEYLHEMTEVIFHHSGTLDKYIGDGIMALFGAPRLSDTVESDHNALAAVQAALDMITAHQKLMARLDTRKQFEFRIGINTGPVYAGFFGTRQRLEYTVIGDTVNTAARLEAAANPNSILIGEATYQAISNIFNIQEMGELQLKGKTQRVRAYMVLGRSS